MKGTVSRVVDRIDVGQRFVDPADFVLGAAEPVDPEIVTRDPNLSLYCIDFQDRTAMFVDTGPDVSMNDAVFMYEAQREHARRVVKIPLDSMHAIAQSAPIDADKIALVYSVGRCGSTLVSQALGLCPGVASLSEPDVATQLLSVWGRRGLEDPQNQKLLRDCTLLQCLPSQLTGSTHWALKFRSYVTILGPLFRRSLPEARVVFLYRGFKPWFKSFVRMLGGGDLSALVEKPEYVAFLATVIPQLEGRSEVSLLEMVVCSWLGVIEAAQALGPPKFLLRYEELSSAPHTALAALVRHCAFHEPDPADLDRVLRQDSQAGSILSQSAMSELKVDLSAKDLENISVLLRRHSSSIGLETILDGTFMPP